ncbi:MAG: hypothetical protein PF961_05200 [Planctomycetota bacterium]|jgi:hypothetical protein|nr:hypothetical protein [Planctomycetota bacterium]
MAFDTSKLTTIGMFAGAGTLFLIAGLTTWGGVNRFFAGQALGEHATAMFVGDVGEARQAARSAAGWLGDDARAVLPATDPTDLDSDDRLRILSSRVPGIQRRDVLAARNFGRAILGQELDIPDQMSGGDGELIRHLAELAELTTGSLPDLPELPRHQAPSIDVLHYTLEQRLATAWRIADSVGVRNAAATLLALDPRHPAQDELALISVTLDRTGNSAMITMNAKKLDEARRVNAIRGLISLLEKDSESLGHSDRDERIAKLINQIPANQRSGEEMARWMSSGNRKLEDVVAAAERDGSETVVIAAINRAFERERYDLAKKLAPKLPKDKRRAVELAVAEYTWDTATLKQLAAKPEEYLPTIINPSLSFDYLCFHVSSPSGAIPRQDVYVKVNGEHVAAHQVRRFASLIKVPTSPGAKSVDLEVTLNEDVIFSGRVER